MGRDELSRSLSELGERLRRGQRELAERELTNLAQVQIVQELLAGRRTVAELVRFLYSLEKGDPGFNTHYSRVRGELRQMESRGLVWRRPFGRHRPYQLTQMGIARLTMIEGVKPALATRVATRIDLVLYVSVLVLGMLSIWASSSSRDQSVCSQPSSSSLGALPLQDWLRP